MRDRLVAVLHFLYSVRGRTGNAAYVLYYAVLAMAARGYLIAQKTMGHDFGVTPESQAVIILLFLSILSGTIVLTRRLHDIGLGAGWGIAAVGLPLLAGFKAIALLFCIFAACIPGETGPNRFGREPRGLKGFFLDRKLARLGRDFVRGRLTAGEFNAKRSALISPPRPAASSS
jgi:uncharacterized membrane protein YhaH (DUF805 family)